MSKVRDSNGGIVHLKMDADELFEWMKMRTRARRFTDKKKQASVRGARGNSAGRARADQY